MTTEEKEIALAELAGLSPERIEFLRENTAKYQRQPQWREIGGQTLEEYYRNGPTMDWVQPVSLPDSQDLNKLHAIAMAQKGAVQTAMRPFLFGACGQARVHIHTADQFCEALLRAAKKWKDE